MILMVVVVVDVRELGERYFCAFLTLYILSFSQRFYAKIRICIRLCIRQYKVMSDVVCALVLAPSQEKVQKGNPFMCICHCSLLQQMILVQEQELVYLGWQAILSRPGFGKFISPGIICGVRISPFTGQSVFRIADCCNVFLVFQRLFFSIH